MTDFRLQRNSQKQESSYQLLKQKLELIMDTLNQQRQEFTKNYQLKTKHYESQLLSKDQTIAQLQAQLQQSNNTIAQSKQQSQKYKAIVNELKQQFFKMTSIVKTPPKAYQQLKRVKSDYIQSNFARRVDLNKHNSSPAQTQKFDINAYFQNVKFASKFIKKSKQQLNDYESKASNTIKNFSNESLVSEQSAFTETQPIFQKTLKWNCKKNVMDEDKQKKKVNRVKIREFKQNIWNQRF